MSSLSRLPYARAWIAGIVLTVALVALSAYVMGESPPRKIVLATGQPGGVYDHFGREYQVRIGRHGLKVQLVNSAGSIDNYHRIINGMADIAFAQSGTYQPADDPDRKVTGLAAIYYEPLWIFTRRGVDLEDRKKDFRARSVAVGPRGSGTEAVAKAIITEQGYDIGSSAIVNMAFADARAVLMEGKLDLAFFVTSYRDPGIMALLRR